jgi:lipopolysaccharide export system protein LptC
MDARAIFTMIGLVAAAVLTGLLLFRTEARREGPTPGPQLGTGYYLRNARLTGTGSDGRTLYLLSARSVTQTLADGSVALEAVNLDYDPGAEAPWNVRADTGRVPAGANTIQLTGNVVAATRDTGQPAATIRTDYLEFDPETYIAATDREVTIDYAGGTVHATGMRAMLRDDRLQLLSDVTGHYVP